MLVAADASPAPGGPPETPNAPTGRLLPPTLCAVALAAVMSATATPDEKRLAFLAGLGAPQEGAALALHLAPVLLAAVLVPIGWALLRGRSKPVQIGALAALGGVVGFVTGLCLNLFAAIIPLIEGGLGPLKQTSLLEYLAWALVIYCLASGAVMALLATFGTPAMRAISTDADPDCTTVRGADRKMYAWTAVGMLGFAAAVAALALLHQSQALDGGRLWVLAAVAGLGLSSYLLSSLVLWRSFDELLRRIVVESLAWTGAIATALCVAWTIAQAAGLAPPMTAYGVTILLLLLQTIAPTWLSIRLAVTEAR
jgi:hypothetical protein